MPKTGDPEYRPSWKNRRIVIFSTLAFDAAVLVAIVTGWYLGMADVGFVSVIGGAVVLRSTTIIASYVFGAAWEDIKLWKH